MATYLEPDSLLGRRFTADFQVVSIGDDPDLTVTLRRMDAAGRDQFALSWRELRELIETGFVVEYGHEH